MVQWGSMMFHSSFCVAGCWSQQGRCTGQMWVCHCRMFCQLYHTRQLRLKSFKPLWIMNLLYLCRDAAEKDWLALENGFIPWTLAIWVRTCIVLWTVPIRDYAVRHSKTMKFFSLCDIRCDIENNGSELAAALAELIPRIWWKMIRPPVNLARSQTGYRCPLRWQSKNK